MSSKFGYLLGLAALAIGGCAAFFSVFGISKLFAGAATSVIVMASALEFGKLVAASYLQRYWKIMPKLIRIYVVTGVTVLVIITSAGIYGFLSSAFQSTYQKLEVTNNELVFLRQKETFFKEDVARYDEELDRISKNISTLSDAKATSIQVRDKNSETGFRNTVSTAELKAAQERIKVEEQNRKDMQALRSVASDSLQKYQLLILDKENNSDISGELGPLKYISELTGAPMQKVVNYFILALIFVFDPLAVTLVVATNWVFIHHGRKPEEVRVVKEVKSAQAPPPPVKVEPLKQEQVDKALEQARNEVKTKKVSSFLNVFKAKKVEPVKEEPKPVVEEPVKEEPKPVVEEPVINKTPIPNEANVGVAKNKVSSIPTNGNTTNRKRGFSRKIPRGYGRN